ncbi:MAG: Dihydroorotase, partial [Alphaproteobacteria bacterium MarineAlpha5_Bin8]
MMNRLNIIKPDDWHVHLREGKMLNIVSKFSTRINNRCIVMPNLTIPITNTELAKKYKSQILSSIQEESFIPLIPCYLTDNLDLKDFRDGLINGIFIGAKLYPLNSTTNSDYGVSNIEKIFPALEILEEHNKNLLIHGEKVAEI